MRIASSGAAILSLIISRKWLGGLSLNAPQNKSRQCPDSEIRNISISPFSEFRNRKDTSNVLIPSVVLVSKFARRSISECGELRNHDTRLSLGLFAALGPHFGQRALQHPNLHIVGDLDHELAIVLDLGHLADQSAGGDDGIAAANRLHHLLVGLNALLLRPDQKKIEDAKEQDQRHHGRNKGVVQIHFAISWDSLSWPRRNIASRPSFATAASLGPVYIVLASRVACENRPMAGEARKAYRVIRLSASTNRRAIFAATRRDASLLADRRVARRWWTFSPRRSS